MPAADDPATVRRDTRVGAARAATGLDPTTVLCALVLVVGGIVLRWAVLRSPLGLLNSDEATGGLMAYEILEHRPGLMLAGANYGGAIEAYPTAVLLRLLGPSTLLPKLVSVALWAATAVQLARLVHAAVGRRAGLLAGASMWCASGTVAYLSTLAYPGYASGLLAFVTYLRRLGEAMPPLRGETCTHTLRTPRWWALTGLAAGIAAWQHPMFGALAVAPSVVVAVALLARRPPVTHWSRVLPAWAGGALIGVGPVLYNLARRGRAALDEGTTPFARPYPSRLASMATELAPRALGLRRSGGAWFGGPTLGHVLYAALAFVCVVGARRALHHRGLWPLLATLAAPPLLAAFAHLSYFVDGRYFVGLLPVVVVCLVVVWGGAGPGRAPRVPRGLRAAAPVGAVVTALVLCVPWSVAELPDARGDQDAGVRGAVRVLDTTGVKAIDGDYWAVYTIVFRSGHRLRGAVPIAVRFPRDQAEVQRTPPEGRGWVYRAGSDPGPQPPFPLTTHERIVSGDYVLYIPRQAGAITGSTP